MSDLQTLQDQANALAVCRLELKGLEEELQKELDSNPKIQELQEKINLLKLTKEREQQAVMDLFKDSGLKSVKTEFANISMAKRYSVQMQPEFKKLVEGKLKGGESVDGFELKTTEFVSIRAV